MFIEYIDMYLYIEFCLILMADSESEHPETHTY